MRPRPWSWIVNALAGLVLSAGVLHAEDALRAATRVLTDKGRVEGSPTADGKVIAFKGIPFAEPPLEDLRWKPPQPARKWKGVYRAQDFGNHCIQFGAYPDMVFHDAGASEDCLTLNVWAPVQPKKKDKKSPGLPVMVWIHGGGFTSGGSSEPRQDGEFLAERGVVVVSMNYRLGIFGFFTHPELAEESRYGASGNYGLMDQTAALEWVRRNVAGFGGDPDNVTIFGESVGAFSVSAQMASPTARGLFTKAIGESGGAFYNALLSFRPHAELEQEDVKFAERVFGTSKLFYLRSLSTEDLVKAAMARTRPGPPRFLPDVDGYFLRDSVPNLFAGGKQAHVPLLAGWNADEVRSTVTNATVRMTVTSFTQQVQADFGANAAGFLAAYLSASGRTDADAERAAGDYAGDKFIVYSTWRFLEAQVQTGGAPVYRYLFALGSPGDVNHPANAGAFHSDDIEYVFGTLDSRPGMKVRPEDRTLSQQIGAYWTNFAKTGDPNGAGPTQAELPKWPTYSAASGWQVMRLDSPAVAGPDTMRGRYTFLDSVWSK